MSKLMLHIVPGVFAALILMLINSTLVPEGLYNSEGFNHFMSVCYFACIIIPCIVYYVRTGPGENNKPH